MAKSLNSRTGLACAEPAAVAIIEAEIIRIQTLKPDQVIALWRDTFKREVGPCRREIWAFTTIVPLPI
jgi:hypothetical protein